MFFLWCGQAATLGEHTYEFLAAGGARPLDAPSIKKAPAFGYSVQADDPLCGSDRWVVELTPPC